MENILLDFDMNSNKIKVKLCDFGSAQQKRGTRIYEFGSSTSLLTMAPELLDHDFDVMYDNKIDSWSLGIVLHELLTFKSPFFSECRHTIVKQICKTEIDYDKLRGPQ